MKSWRLVICALLTALVLQSPLAVPAASRPPFTIDVLLSATGPGAFLGGSQIQTLRLLETETNQHGGINGRPIHFNIHDDGTNPQTSVQLASAMIARHVPIILGSTLCALCKAMMPLMTDTVEYCFSPAIDPTPGGNVFSAFLSTPDLFRATVRYAREQGFTRIAMLTPTDATGQDGDRALQHAMSELSNPALKVVAWEHFAPADLSVTAQLAKIHAANPEMIIAWASGTAIATVLHGVIDAGISVPIVTSAANMTYAQMTAVQGFLPKGGLLFPSTQLQRHDFLRPGPLKTAQDSMIAAFKQHNIVLEPAVATSWDPALITLDAFRHLGFNATSKQLHDYIENIRGFSGVVGVYNFSDGSQRGVGLGAVVIAQWVPAKHDWVAISSSGGSKLDPVNNKQAKADTHVHN